MGRDDETYDDTDSDSADSDSDDSSVDAPPRVPHVPRLYLRLNEPWRGRVRRDRVREEMETAEAAARELSLAIATDLAPLAESRGERAHAEKSTVSPGARPAQQRAVASIPPRRAREGG